MDYNFADIEKKWQARWAAEKTFKADNHSSKPKYYVLDMFPYPSGTGLHVGHPLGYIASDIFSRYKRHKGFNVLHPMGYDSFGLPAEQFAIQTGQHPAVTTEQNIARYREQMDKIGFSYDWDRELRTSDPAYYKWTQWIFIQLFNSWYNPRNNKAEDISTLVHIFETEGFKGLEHDILTGDIEHELNGFTPAEWKTFDEKRRSDILMNFRLAYLGEAYVNWCPAMGTVLANDEVKDGVSERGGYPVERKLMKQWSMRITVYAQRLLDGLDKIDWTDSLKEAQRNWIGRSEGTSLKFKLSGGIASTIEVFTTRPDTVFGVSFVTLAPEHELVEQITAAEQKKAVDEYVTFAKNRSERERQADVNKISGVFTGAYVEHPFTGKPVPVWVGDYVLAGYGTGAVMAVPAHDERDYKFAKHFGLPLPQVIAPNKEHSFEEDAWGEKEGKLINSDFLNGLEVKAAIKKAIEEIEKLHIGKGKTNYRLRDAVFGRQRYWGEPIPVYYRNEIPHIIEELPLRLPEIDKYLPTEDGEPPLARADKWSWDPEKKQIVENGKGFPIETTTMPGWAGSSWYFLRYEDVYNEKEFVSRQAVDYWQNVDLYIGGSEHATGHLLYVRFWTMALKDLGYINVEEPAKKLINQGMIQGRSNFAYRMPMPFGLSGEDTKKNTPELQSKIHKLIPSVFISKNKAKLLAENDSKTYSELVELLKETKMAIQREFNLPTFHFIDSPQTIPMHVDVNMVENDVLDLTAFKNWRDDLRNSIFLLEEGKYICGAEVEKMSKSKWNVVSPDNICEKFGADTLRLYEMFLGPLELSKPWNTNGITGVSGFLRKLWKLFYKDGQFVVTNDAPTKDELKALHKTIQKITADIERFSFNTSVSNFMICVNELTDLKCNKREILEPLLTLISPYAPHITEELWEQLGHRESIAYAPFPVFNAEHVKETSFSYPVSFNGKVRFNVEFDLSLSKEDVEKEVLSLEQTSNYLEGKAAKKVIVVPGRIINIVV
jgi:leucyl-tRNA synthetase